MTSSVQESGQSSGHAVRTVEWPQVSAFCVRMRGIISRAFGDDDQHACGSIQSARRADSFSSAGPSEGDERRGAARARTDPHRSLPGRSAESISMAASTRSSSTVMNASMPRGDRRPCRDRRLGAAKPRHDRVELPLDVTGMPARADSSRHAALSGSQAMTKGRDGAKAPGEPARRRADQAADPALDQHDVGRHDPTAPPLRRRSVYTRP